MINHTTLLLGISLSLMLAGCQQGQQKAGVDFPEKEATDQAQVQPPVDSSKPQPIAVAPGSEVPSGSPNGQRPDQAAKPVEPKKPDVKWEDANAELLDVAKKMDVAIRGLTGVTCEYSLYLKTPREEGTSNGMSYFIDPENFSIEAIDLDNMFGKIKVVSNGDEAKEMGKSGWIDRPAAGKPSARANEPATRGIMPRSSLVAFSSLTEGINYWSNLVKGMQSEGYQVKLVTADMDVYGKERPFYKIVSQRAGKGINDLSITVDGTRFVPLTVKVIETRADGRYETEWRTRFKFGEKIEPEKVKLPN
jgi:hypothetical protein